VGSQTLSAEDVLRREIDRFEARAARAEKEHQEASKEVERLKRALAVLTDGQPSDSSS
jgi:hypothetical protein